MSTRYVWNRYTIRNTVQYEETKIGEIDVGQEEILYTISGEPAASFDPLYYALVDSWEDYVENPITFPYTVENGQAITIPPRRCLIFSPSKSAQTVQDGAIIYYNPTSSISANVICTNSGGSWSIAKKGTGTFAGDVIQYDKEVEEVRYNTVEECPSWARETVQKLIDKGYLGGDGQSLDLSHDMVRVLVIQDRAGGFGA